MKTVAILCSLSLALTACALSTLPGAQFSSTASMWPKSGLVTGKRIQSPAFSPDGKEIVFSLSSKTSSSLYKINADGTNLTLIGNSGGFDHSPVFTPDGKSIVFSSARDGKNSNLFVMKADGSEKASITTGPYHDFSPVISPDGSKVYFARSMFFGNYSPVAAPGWHNNDIYSVNLDGTGFTQITYKRFYRVGNLSTHPDGRRLLVEIPTPSEAHSIWTLNIESPTDLVPVEPDLGEYRTILSSLGGSGKYAELRHPMFSPDGTSLVFTWRRNAFGGNKEGIFIMNLETKRVSRIADMDSLIWSGPSFSPDGGRIVFSTLETDPLLRDSPNLWIVNSDGTGTRAVNFR